MRLIDRVGTQTVVILVDTCSTYNFMDQNVAKKIQLPVKEESKLTIMVANGDTIPCLACYKTVSFNLQGYNFQTTLYLLILRGCDIVLGVDWLSTLGPILWDFIELTMKFTHKNREVALQGLVSAVTNLEVGETIPKKAR
jgi:hypothetical protein